MQAVRPVSGKESQAPAGVAIVGCGFDSTLQILCPENANVTTFDLMVRVGPDLYEHALRQAHAREMDFTGRPMKGFVFVDADGFVDDARLKTWVQLSEQFVRQLPPK